MKTPQIQEVIRTARALPDNDHVPFAFEQRVMALIRARRTATDPWGVWSRLMGRAALACVVVSIMTGALAQFREEPAAPDLLALDLEQAVIASIIPEETW